MNIPNNYTNPKSEMYKTGIVLETKETIIENRCITITKDLEETRKTVMIISELHDLMLIYSRGIAAQREVGSCEFPMIIEYN